MRTNLLKTLPLASATALALAASMPASAQAPATPPPAPAPAPAAAPAAPAAPANKIQYSGLFDGYYAWDFNNPKSNVISIGGGTRFYDTRHDTPTLALGELNVWEAANPGAFGFKATLGAGDIAEINAGGGVVGTHFVEASSTNEGQFKALMQAYGTYGLPKGAGIDVGKFYTPIGYEVTESNGNFNETHSVPFDIIPFYHFGVRAYTPSYNGLVLTGYVVQAVYNTATAGVENDSGNASFVGNAVWTDPKGKWTVGDSLGLGKNKFNLSAGDDPTKNKVTVNDTDLTYNFNANNIGGLNYTYAQTNPDNTSDSFKATDNAWAVYYKHVLTPKTDVAFRYSAGQFKDDEPGFTTQKPWEATATYEVHPSSNFLYRLEYQHFGDSSGSPSDEIFDDHSNAFTKSNQDTVELAGVFTFGS